MYLAAARLATLPEGRVGGHPGSAVTARLDTSPCWPSAGADMGAPAAATGVGAEVLGQEGRGRTQGARESQAACGPDSWGSDSRPRSAERPRDCVSAAYPQKDHHGPTSPTRGLTGLDRNRVTQGSEAVPGARLPRRPGRTPSASPAPLCVRGLCASVPASPGARGHGPGLLQTAALSSARRRSYLCPSGLCPSGLCPSGMCPLWANPTPGPHGHWEHLRWGPCRSGRGQRGSLAAGRGGAGSAGRPVLSAAARGSGSVLSSWSTSASLRRHVHAQGSGARGAPGQETQSPA